MATTTPNYGLTKPAIQGDKDSWGEMINGDLDILDTVIDAVSDRVTAIETGGGGGGPFVPQTTQVIAGPGLSGGGALAADVTITANVLTVQGRTGDVVLTAQDISGAGGVPATRQVIAGAGLGGGGPLSGDVTLTANVKTVFGRTGDVILTPAEAATIQTPWLQNINGNGFRLGNVTSMGIGIAAQPATGDLLRIEGANDGNYASMRIQNNSTSGARGSYVRLGSLAQAWQLGFGFNTGADGDFILTNGTAGGQQIFVSAATGEMKFEANVAAGIATFALNNQSAQVVVGTGVRLLFGDGTSLSGSPSLCPYIASAIDAAASADLQFATHFNNVVTERMRIAGNGDVGIGLPKGAAPLTRLDVAAGGADYVMALRNGPATNRLYFQVQANGTFTLQNNSFQSMFTISPAGAVTFYGLPSTNPGAGSKQMWYDPADGNRVKFAA